MLSFLHELWYKALSIGALENIFNQSIMVSKPYYL